jgi:hypothetical protein
MRSLLPLLICLCVGLCIVTAIAWLTNWLHPRFNLLLPIMVASATLVVIAWSYRAITNDQSYWPAMLLIVICGLALTVAEHYWSWQRSLLAREEALQQEIAKNPQAAMFAGAVASKTWAEYMTVPPEERWSTWGRWCGIALAKIVVASVLYWIVPRFPFSVQLTTSPAS